VSSGHKPEKPIAIHEQKCYDCGRPLVAGQEAVACTHLPLAFCIPCRGAQEQNNPRLVKAFVRAES